MNLRIIDLDAKSAVTHPNEVKPGEIRPADVPGILARRAIAIYKFTTENQGANEADLITEAKIIHPEACLHVAGPETPKKPAKGKKQSNAQSSITSPAAFSSGSASASKDSDFCLTPEQRALFDTGMFLT
jgi:hypothetical protein